MIVNINLKVVPFGQMGFEIGIPFAVAEQQQIVPQQEPVYYYEPSLTSSHIYDINYDNGGIHYIVPSSTA